jgi:hypothetical protein
MPPRLRTEPDRKGGRVAWREHSRGATQLDFDRPAFGCERDGIRSLGNRLSIRRRWYGTEAERADEGAQTR